MKKNTYIPKWFECLRNKLCQEFELIEADYIKDKNLTFKHKFQYKKWTRKGGGGGTIAIMKGNVFEKVGVNISTVYGEFSKSFRTQIPGAKNDPRFYATGISVVSHMCSPLIPAMHFNTRYITTNHGWFGGAADLTPTYLDNIETNLFHFALKRVCDKYSCDYYPKFKKHCDEYFFLKYRNEPRGVGGIFYDYLNNNFSQDYAFTRDLGKTISSIYPQLVRNKMHKTWTRDQRDKLLLKRGRYVEFNLLHDRGTIFGLSTGGNIESILMSMPPEVKWL